MFEGILQVLCLLAFLLIVQDIEEISQLRGLPAVEEYLDIPEHGLVQSLFFLQLLVLLDQSVLNLLQLVKLLINFIIVSIQRLGRWRSRQCHSRRRNSQMRGGRQALPRVIGAMGKPSFFLQFLNDLIFVSVRSFEFGVLFA